MQSYQLQFNSLVAEGNQVAASYDLIATKKDGTILRIRLLEIFTIENGKIIHGDELTHLLSGPTADKNLSDHR